MNAVWQAVAVLSGIVLLGFVLTRVLPGDPLAVMVQTPGMSAEAMAQLRRDLGLEASIPEQFGRYLWGLVQGDWGVSRVTGQPVLQDIALRLPASLEVALAGFVPTVLGTLALGWALARRPGGIWDHVARALALLGVALPVFVCGLGLIFVFYVVLDWAPEPSGRLDPMLEAPPKVFGLYVLDALWAGDWPLLRAALAQLVLPGLTLTLFGVASLIRMFRAALLAALSGAGARGARALGLPQAVILRHYVFPEALGPVIPAALILFGYMLGASVLVEKTFAWPGIGRYALDALAALDYAAVQGVLLVLALVHLVLSLLAERLALWLDPRLAAFDA